jgi:lactoylglutathione lyase
MLARTAPGQAPMRGPLTEPILSHAARNDQQILTNRRRPGQLPPLGANADGGGDGVRIWLALALFLARTRVEVQRTQSAGELGVPEPPTLGAMKARLVGINHVALEVGDVDEALAWYARIFSFELRGRAGTMAFIEMGDQFLALSAPREQTRDDDRHFGLVVDDKEAVRDALEQAEAVIVPTRGLRFVDPWGNSVEVVQYDQVQFSKTDTVLRGMGFDTLGKTEAAIAELREKGLGS